jgi:YD repeat-containing protein
MRKILFSTVTLCLIVLLSCSNSDDENSMEENSTNVEKLITQLTSQRWQQEHSNFYNPDKFIYENEKLVKAWFYGCSGALYEFEYGTNGKISTVYRKGSISHSDISISIKDVGEKRNHIYDNKNNLITITDDSEKVLASLDYDSDGRLIKVDVKDLSIAKPDTFLYSDFDNNGNPQKNNAGFEYSYDDKVNPIYILFKKYGFFNVEMCNSFDDRRLFYVSPSNVQEIIDTEENNEVIFSAIYTYDSDGYPTTNSFNSKLGIDHSDVESYNY